MNSLSRRESEVLELVKQGRFQKEIAAALFISPKTVAAHFRNIHDKLDLEPGTSLLQGLARKQSQGSRVFEPSPTTSTSPKGD